MPQLPYQDIIHHLIHSGNYDVEHLSKLKKEFASQHKLSDIPTNIKLIKAYRELVKMGTIKKDEKLEQLLKKRGIRSQSGIVSVQVLTKPWPCPGKCIFCPDESGMPKSYIKSEPGAMRAALNQFDPIKQVYNRLHSLSVTGHETDKIEMIVLGGTWDSYPHDYKTQFVKSLYDACNTFSKLKIKYEKQYCFDIINLKKIKYSKTLAEAIKKNEHAKHRIIGLTIETRPEFVTDQNCRFWRELGVTRVEMGVQSLNDKVLEANQRGHTVQQIRQACDRLRRWGFKICTHVMPGLYKSSYAKDLKTFVDLYADPFLKPDEIKFYPTSVIPGTKLAELYKQGKYTPLETDDIKKLIRACFLNVIPPYTRIKRLIRDIPATEIMAGSKVTNLAQLMHAELRHEMQGWNAKKLKIFYERLWPNMKIIKSVEDVKSVKGDSGCSFAIMPEGLSETFIIGQRPDVKTLRNFVSLDTRSREVRHAISGSRVEERGTINLVIRRYVSSVGMEYFISYEDQLGYLYGFARLLLPTNSEQLTTNSAMVRELHVYGNVETLKSTKKVQSTKVQHTGFGKKLMEAAETLAKQGGYEKIAVISGVGVRGYYRKLGYRLENTYMVKSLDNH